jgi:hypothetical protein
MFSAFGILYARWRIFFRPLHVKWSTCKKVVKAACLLHNFLRTSDGATTTTARYIPPRYTDYYDDNGDVVDGSWRQRPNNNMLPLAVQHGKGRNYSANAKLISDRLTRYFISDIDSLPWQRDYIHRGRKPQTLI